jgi:hemerythrin
MQWRDEYATGVERIDEDHKMIFKMAEDFRAVLDDGKGDATYSVLLDSLSLYCRGHFGFEEGCMRKYHCPVAEKNKAAHQTFLETLSEFQERYAANGYDYADARKLVDTVDGWLDSHICRIDVHLKRCVNK